MKVTPSLCSYESYVMIRDVRDHVTLGQLKSAKAQAHNELGTFSHFRRFSSTDRHQIRRHFYLRINLLRVVHHTRVEYQTLPVVAATMSALDRRVIEKLKLSGTACLNTDAGELASANAVMSTSDD